MHSRCRTRICEIRHVRLKRVDTRKSEWFADWLQVVDVGLHVAFLHREHVNLHFQLVDVSLQLVGVDFYLLHILVNACFDMLLEDRGLAEQIADVLRAEVRYSSEYHCDVEHEHEGTVHRCSAGRQAGREAAHTITNERGDEEKWCQEIDHAAVLLHLGRWKVSGRAKEVRCACAKHGRAAGSLRRLRVQLCVKPLADSARRGAAVRRVWMGCHGWPAWRVQVRGRTEDCSWTCCSRRTWTRSRGRSFWMRADVGSESSAFSPSLRGPQSPESAESPHCAHYSRKSSLINRQPIPMSDM